MDVKSAEKCRLIKRPLIYIIEEDPLSASSSSHVRDEGCVSAVFSDKSCLTESAKRNDEIDSLIRPWWILRKINRFLVPIRQ